MTAPRHSIKQQIVLSFIIMLVAIFGITGYFVYVNWLRTVEKTTATILTSAGERVYRQIDRFVDVPLNINRYNVEPIRHGLVDLADDGKRDLYFVNQIKTAHQDVYSFTYGDENGYFFGARRNPQNEIEVYKNNAQTNGKNRYYIVNPDLSTGAFVMETARFDPRSRDWYQTAKIQRGPFFSPVYLHFVMNDLAFSAAEPVYATSGELLGVVGTHVTLSRLNQHIKMVAEEYGGLVYVVEAETGNLVANSHEKANWQRSGTQQIERIPLEQVAEPEITRAYRDWRSQKTRVFSDQQWFIRIQQYERLGLNWLIIAAVPQEPYMAPLMQGVYYSLLLALVVIVLASVLYVKSTNIVLAPIRNLIQTTERFSAGEFSERAAVFRDDEIGVLSSDFNKMADEICELINSLEVKIKERTGELEQMNRLAIEAQNEAQAANAAKGAFLANMSHELRTPLNSVLGYSELLIGDPALSARHRESLDIIHRSGTHMLSLINEVMEAARIESKKIVLSCSLFDLHHLATEVTQMLAGKAAAKSLDFTVTGQESLPRQVLGDPTKLRVVLINLIVNAVKFTDRGGVKVFFAATVEQPGEILFAAAVEDTGSGIDPAEQNQLFQFFSQTESGRLSQSGTGLGLAISQEYIRMMGGEIRVASQVGVGSRFNFEIALKLSETKSQDMTEAFRRRIVGLKEGCKTPRVLIAEDMEENRLLLQRQLGVLGAEVYLAADGREAVEQFLRYEPDLIWMDLRMPGMDGIEATRRIRSTPQGGRTKIIALSAHADELQPASMREAGFDEYLAKPYPLADLYRIMGDLLGLEYLYDTDAEPQGEKTSTQLEIEDWRAALPEEIRKSLLDAVVKLDTAVIQQIILELKAQQPEAAEILAELAANYEYSRMYAVLQSRSLPEK